MLIGQVLWNITSSIATYPLNWKTGNWAVMTIGTLKVKQNMSMTYHGKNLS